MWENIPLISSVNSFLSRFSGFTVFLLSICLYLVFVRVLGLVRFVYNYEGGLIAGVIELVFPYVQKSRFVSSKVGEEKQRLLNKTISNYSKREVREYDVYSLPEKGIDSDEILKRIRNYIRDFGDRSFERGTCSGAIYSVSDPEQLKVLNEAYCVFSVSNALYYDLFPAICKFEREIVRCTRDLMHGNSDVKGVVTQGGSESLMLSLKAYREYYSKKKPGIVHPEIVTLESIHAAVDKGCHLCGLKLTKVKVDRKVTFTATPEEVERYITKNTIVLYVSAPCFPYGIIDDVEGMAALARKYDIGLHVDSCLGGYYCPFAYRLGFDIPKFDFLVDGVTSISADTHKFGLAPKGTSVLLFRNMELRNSCFFLNLKWQGGLYATPTFSGSRSGGVIAACWVALMINGMDNYMRITTEIHETAVKIKEGVGRIRGVKVAGNPQAMVINIMVDDKEAAEEYRIPSIFQVSDEMKKSARGWHLQATQNPQGFHFCLTARNCGDVVAQNFIADLEVAVEKVRKDKKLHHKDSASLYGIAGYAPKRLLGDIGMGVLAYFLDGKEEGEVEEEEEEILKKEK